MLRDQIVEDVRAVRERLLAETGGLDAYVEKIRKLESQETEPLLQPPARDGRKGDIA